ncbi:hypothetical protein U713_16675 [Rhodobacter capsulatus YW2]|nr:hypothetical protein U713_16675 [Rhodobacter capsulatus YW2]
MNNLKAGTFFKVQIFSSTLQLYICLNPAVFKYFVLLFKIEKGPR